MVLTLSQLLMHTRQSYYRIVSIIFIEGEVHALYLDYRSQLDFVNEGTLGGSLVLVKSPFQCCHEFGAIYMIGNGQNKAVELYGSS